MRERRRSAAQHRLLEVGLGRFLPSHRDLVGELDPADFCGECRCGEKRGDIHDQELAHQSVLLMKTVGSLSACAVPRKRKRAARGTGSPIAATNEMESPGD